jgi:hypothetical protein
MKKLLPILFDVVPIFAVAGYALWMLFAHDPTMQQIVRLVALATLCGTWHLLVSLNIRSDLNTVNELKELSQLVQAQDLILHELQAANKLNTETSAFIVSQAELLQRLTSSAVAKKKAETVVPGSLAKIPAVGLTASEIAKANG